MNVHFRGTDHVKDQPFQKRPLWPIWTVHFGSNPEIVRSISYSLWNDIFILSFRTKAVVTNFGQIFPAYNPQKTFQLNDFFNYTFYLHVSRGITPVL